MITDHDVTLFAHVMFAVFAVAMLLGAAAGITLVAGLVKEHLRRKHKDEVVESRADDDVSDGRR